MDVGFENIQSGFADFDAELEDFRIKKVRKFDRMFMVGGGGSIDTVPFIENGIAYFGEANGYVYAVRVENGETLWRFKTDGGIFGSCPMINNGKLYIGSYDYYMYCLDASTGEMLWRFRTGDKVFGSPNVAKGKVYFGSIDGYVYALEADTGSEVWRFRTGEMVGSCPEIWNGRVYIGSHDSNLYCLDAETGKEVWRFRTGGEIMNCLPFTIKDGILYFGSFDNFLYVINADTGKELWRFRTGEYGNSGVPVIHRKTIYFVARDGILYALTLDGKEIWRYRLSGVSTWQKPQISDKGMYIISEDGYLYCIGFDGRELNKKRINTVMVPPVLHKDMILVGSWDCNLYAYDLEGRELWVTPTSTKEEAFFPPPNDSFKLEINKETHTDDTISEDRYASKRKGETVSLSDYHLTSEYSTKSEYKQKSDYDINFVMFENIMEVEGIWLSALKVSKQPTLMSS